MPRPKLYIEERNRRTLRLPLELAEAIDLYAAKQGMSTNAAMIELLGNAISGMQSSRKEQAQ